MASILNPLSVKQLQILGVAINASSNGNNTVVAAVSGKRILVIGYKYIATSAVTATWESSGGTVLDGPCALAANGGAQEPNPSPNDDGTFIGLFATLPGEGLVLNLGSGVQVGGNVRYAVV